MIAVLSAAVEFQSRNRVSSNFNEIVFAGFREDQVLFQSRNRVSSNFNGNWMPVLRPTLNALFQSRNRVSSNFNDPLIGVSYGS